MALTPPGNRSIQKNDQFVNDVKPKNMSFTPPESKLETELIPGNLSAGKSGKRENEFHVDFLKNQFRDLARPNYFKVKVIPPISLKNDWNNDLLVLAKSAMFPSVEVVAHEMERMGRTLYIPTNKIQYGDLTITFHNDVDFQLRSMFLRWQHYVLFNPHNGKGNMPLQALSGNVEVYQFDSGHKETFFIGCNNAWPKTVGDVALSHDTTDSTEEFTVTFAFTNIYNFRKN